MKNSTDEYYRRLALKWLAILALGYFVYLLVFFFCGKTGSVPRIFALGIFVLAYMPLRFAMRFLRRGQVKTAFASTSLFAVLAVFAHCLGAYPYIVAPSSTSAGVEIFEASSTLMTLEIMTVVAAIGMPLALGYFAYSHAVFSKGKNTKEDKEY